MAHQVKLNRRRLGLEAGAVVAAVAAIVSGCRMAVDYTDDGRGARVIRLDADGCEQPAEDPATVPTLPGG